ncbi:MAG: cytochrome-c oxidase, cbb3-type subunit II [Gammaproteobacteria bacterium]|nr:cytochrome-c oxidase, cbb3-type subunit II [Gammaproteobacteria bacterium]
MNVLGLHKKLEENSGLLIFGILFVSSIGGLVQVLPSIFEDELITPTAETRPYGALELIGRDIYIREGCSTCHSQQVRPLLAEVKRYGPFSSAGESAYDRPFLWGSKRTGPDLHRIGAKFSDAWQRVHLIDPRSVVPNSIMPAYPWLAANAADPRNNIQTRLRRLRLLGHPYSDDAISNAPDLVANKTELDAIVAYLAVLGEAAGSGEEMAH